MLVSAAVVKLMLEERPGYMTGVSKEHICTLHTYLMEGSCIPDQNAKQSYCKTDFMPFG